MAILRSNVMNNNMMKGFAVNQALRAALNAKLYEQTVVIRKFKITKDKEGNVHASFKYGTIGQLFLSQQKSFYLSYGFFVIA